MGELGDQVPVLQNFQIVKMENKIVWKYFHRHKEYKENIEK